MVKLTTKQWELVKVVQANPGIKFRLMLELTGFTGKRVSAFSDLAKTLVDRDILRRTGNKRHYQFYIAEGFDLDSVVTSDPAPGMKKPDENDPLIQEALEISLSDEQITYLKSNNHLPRRQLAEKLGISKLALNLFLIKLNQN
ncbi:hypothetical protein [Paenibacillus sp. JDR-2]|uniref:hypothetical protein n=1 Tax=Paenibacillus sp. (strain JDR-2) TaxID=324057 RepID=UPI000166A3CB|nr:hypothetical protein [Paenibacillus sp. JDR-2]ACT00272.1 hypothetical protein Pjdr2_1603 [Paenibacillus sp. JDR-2]